MSIKSGKSLGEIIHEDIKEKNLNASAIARKMNISRQVINQISTRKGFDLEFLLKLKDASGLDYTHFAYDRVLENLLKEPEPTYSRGSVTLTLNVTCKRERVGEFESFLNDLEAVARRYDYQIV